MATRRKRGRELSAAAAATGGRGKTSKDQNNSNKNLSNDTFISRGLEENTMAMLDSSCFRTSSSSSNRRDFIDDRLTFMEAVRSASLIPDNGIPPTNKMYQAIFKILKEGNSLDLIMGSYQLLSDLEKRFPRVCLSEEEKVSSTCFDAVVVAEAWSPFYFGKDSASLEEETSRASSGGSVDPLVFHSLIECVAKVASCGKSQVLETKYLRDMLLLQYLVRVIEQDLSPRTCAFKVNMNWALMRDSLLSLLLGSRKINYRTLIKDCLSTMCEISYNKTEIHEAVAAIASSSTELPKDYGAVALAVIEVEKSICASLKKFLVMTMELDSSRNLADQQGLTSRADGPRTPAADIILDELTYNTDLLIPFLEVFDEHNVKLKLIVHYFQKYIPTSSVRTRKSNASVNNATLDGILKCLSSDAIAKNIIKKVGAYVVQLLLAHGFQAFLSLSLQHSAEGIFDASDEANDSSLLETCRNTISAFTCLKRQDKDAETIFLTKEAIFSASKILCAKP